MKPGLLWVCAGAVAGLAITGWLWKSSANRRQEEGRLLTSSPTAPQTNGQRLLTSSSTLTGSLSNALSGLRGGRGQSSAPQTLAALRQALAGATTNEAVPAIRSFLDSRADAPTGKNFKVGAKGALTEAPTLRTFLLDYLGTIDPAAAAAYARTVLASMDSPDEWAVALRNLGAGDNSAEGRALLEQKVGELLRNESWQHDPSVGYLEAFDAAVFSGITNLVAPLTDLVRKQDNPAVAHASYLALDRMVLNQPGAMLGLLAAQPDLMQGREATRADYFARADVRDPQQRQVLESYLLDPRTSLAELGQFAGVYPNSNFMVSQNLLTSTPTPDAMGLKSWDAESLRVVGEWLSDERFAKVRPQLEKIKQRLEEFVRQAK